MADPKPTILRLSEVQRGTWPHEDMRPTHEVFAPDGYCFEKGLHSKMAFSAAEAKEFASDPVEPCPADCDCKED